jgi:hypothetical protein
MSLAKSPMVIDLPRDPGLGVNSCRSRIERTRQHHARPPPATAAAAASAWRRASPLGPA